MVTFATSLSPERLRASAALFLRAVGVGLFFAIATAESLVAVEPPLGESHVYKQVDGRSLELHLVKPENWQPSDRRPAIVFYHGGGWTGGGPGQFNEQATYFASRGLVCVLVQYRLLDGKSDAPPLVCIQDSRTAFRWVRGRAATLGIDPARIAAAGGSAGGHLAAHLALVSEPALDDPQDERTISFRPDALILFNPVLDNGPGNFGSRRIGERLREFSPAHNIAPGAPPAVLFLGSADKLIPVPVLENFRDNLRRVNARADLHVYEGQPHGFFNATRTDRKYFTLTVRTADEFLASLGWLHGPATLPSSPDNGASD